MINRSPSSSEFAAAKLTPCGRIANWRPPRLTCAGIAGLGVLRRNVKILASTIPFLVVSALAIRADRTTRQG
jgi:hypothetical protein